MAATGASIGSVYVDVEPRAAAFWTRFMAQAKPGANKAGEEIGAAAGAKVQSSIAKGLVDGIEKGAREAVPKAGKAGAESGEAFGRGFKARIDDALRSLPKVKLDADSTDADRSIAILRAQLQELKSKKIGVDLDADQARAQLDYIKSRLADLEDEHPSVEVQAQVVDAITALDRIKVLAGEVAASDPTVDVDVDGAAATAELAGIGAEARAVGQLDPTINVHADTGAATAQLAAVGGAAVLSTGGVNALIAAGAILGPVIVPAAAAASVAVAGIGIAAISAGVGLGVGVLAIVGVAGAVKAMGDAHKAAGQAAASSAGQQMAVAAAADQVRNAEQGLANAQQSALRAQQALTQAREQARQSLEDLNSQVAGGALAQRQANLDIAKAKGDLDAVNADPAATKAERDQAQLTYDQAKQHITDLGVRQQRLVTQQVAASKAGVDGSQQVRAAQQNIASTQQQVEQATRQVAAAHRSAGQAAVAAGGAGSAAADKLAQAMAGLSPAGREFATFLYGLGGQLGVLRRAAEAGLLPGLQAGIQAVLPYLPQLSDFIGGVAKTMGDLAAEAGKALTSPFWRSFFAFIGTEASPTLRTMASIVGNVARGFAGLLIAFKPVTDQLGAGLAGLAQKFGDFGAGASTNPGFQKFLDYVAVNGPKIAQLLGDMADTFGTLLVALAPLGTLVLDGLLALFGWLASLSPGQLIGVAAGVGAVAAALVLIVGGPVSAVVIGIMLIVGALVYAYNHFTGFRTVVDTVFHAVAAAAVWLWNVVLKPTFENLRTLFVDVIGPAVMFLWRNVIEPAFTAIAAVVSWWWNNVTKPIFDVLAFYIMNFVAPTFMFLWRNVVAPTFEGIKLAISVAWAVIQVIFGLIQIAVIVLSAPFLWFLREVIVPVFSGIATWISQTWHNNIKPIFDVFAGFIRDNVAPAFRAGVDAIGSAWEKIRDKVKEPIRFVVKTVLNDGILGAYNRIASWFGVTPDNLHVTLPAGFATGGHVLGPGGPTDDAILARLSAGEYVIPARIVASLGVGFFDQLIGRGAVTGQRYPGDGSQGLRLPAFADGGIVGWLTSAWKSAADPIGLLKDKIGGMLGNIPGAGVMADVVRGIGTKLLGIVTDYARKAITNLTGAGGYQGPVSADVAGQQAWVRAQAGKPYVWAAAGPGGYDCSGALSALWNMTHGRAIYQHTFSTHDQARYFPLAGSGVFTAGWSNPGDGGPGGGPGDVGHTAGNLAGLGFESRGGDGFVVGSRATPVSAFAHVGHYDDGGWLMPGLTFARNDTGRPEAVLTGEQVASLTRDRATTTIPITVTGSDGMSVRDLAAAVAGELAWQMR